MGIRRAPHRPTEEEIQAGRDLGLPNDDEHKQALLGVVSVGLERGLYDDCISTLLPLVRARFDDPEVYETFGTIYQMKGDRASARACFEAAHAIDADRVGALVNLGEMAWRFDGDAASARKYLGRVLELESVGAMAARANATLKCIDKAKS